MTILLSGPTEISRFPGSDTIPFPGKVSMGYFSTYRVPGKVSMDTFPGNEIIEIIVLCGFEKENKRVLLFPMI